MTDKPAAKVLLVEDIQAMAADYLRLLRLNGFAAEHALAAKDVLTYDDLLERAHQFLLFLQSYRNGDEPIP